MTDIVAPTVGIGAIEVLYTDTIAYVVTRVSKSGKICWVKRVAVSDTPDNVTNPGEPLPCTIHNGILDQPYGDEIRVTFTKRNRWERNGSRFVFGKSYRMVDYRF